MHFFEKNRKKFTQCSKNYIKFIFEYKWTTNIESYTLSRAKSNGIVHFVLSLKLGSLRVFRSPPQSLYFLCNSFSSFSLHLSKNLITDSSSPSKNKSILFKPFFSQVNNKRFSIYGSTSPERTYNSALLLSNLNIRSINFGFALR